LRFFALEDKGNDDGKDKESLDPSSLC